MTALLAGLLFLWAPVLLLVGYAFSADRIPFQWGGFSTRWFGALLDDGRVLEAAGLSLRIAAGSATLAVLLGGLAGWALARGGRFAGRGAFGGLLAAPLVLPEVVLGLALLLLLVGMQAALGWPAGRGAATILIGHATVGTAFVAVLVQARLVGLDPVLENAAADLGAVPATVFRTVTLPLIAPALGAGWLLAFTLSLDDVVLASFLGGPAGTTLPVLLFSRLRTGLTPEVNAWAALVVGAGVLGPAFAWVVAARRPGVRSADGSTRRRAALASRP